MRIVKVSLFLLAFTLHSALSYGQQDTSTHTATSVTQIPLKFITQSNSKIDKYSHCISSRTEKTLLKLTKWENKIKHLLQKTSPKTAEQLFGEGKLTFAAMLAKLQAGQALAENTKAKYNQYTDQLTTHIKYVETQKTELNKKFLQPLANAKQNIAELDSAVAESESAEKLIKERKKELLTQAYAVLGKNKYVKKINKQTYYYTQYLNEYKTIFNDQNKIEREAINILKRLPEFEKFTSENSALSGLFGNFSLQNGSGNSVPILNGLAPRSQLLQAAHLTMGANFNPTNVVAQQLPNIKKRFDNLLGGSGEADAELPDFKPNTQKTKALLKRLEFSNEMQFGGATNYIPTTANIAFTIGYKLNDKFSTGAGMSYILGLGKGWNNLKLTSEGIGFRTYLKMKIKKGYNIQSGSEWNYHTHFDKIRELKNNAWQQAALLGFTKTMKAGKKVKSEVKILYDFLYNSHKPVTQPFIFRVAHNL